MGGVHPYDVGGLEAPAAKAGKVGNAEKEGNVCGVEEGWAGGTDVWDVDGVCVA